MTTDTPDMHQDVLLAGPTTREAAILTDTPDLHQEVLLISPTARETATLTDTPDLHQEVLLTSPTAREMVMVHYMLMRNFNGGNFMLGISW